MEDWNLADVWRIRNPHEKEFTFRRGAYSSRLDLFLISSHLMDVTRKAEILLFHTSNHALVNFLLEFKPSVERGPGFWRFPTHLLSDPTFNEEMFDFLTDWVPPADLTSPTSIWEWLKHEIKSFVRSFSKARKQEEIHHVRELEKDLAVLIKRGDNGEEDLSFPIDSMVKDLREIEERKSRTSIFRSRANWTLYGDKPSKYFLGLEKRRAKESTIASLLTPEGVELNNHKDILREGRRFYQELYASKEQDQTPLQDLEEQVESLNLSVLSQAGKLTLDAPLNEEELRHAAGELNHDRSPGTDGLPPEYYIKFWELLTPYLVRSLDYSIATGTLSHE